MANIRDLNRKIGSLRNMQKVMRAMNMIATTKFKKLSRMQEDLRVFATNLSVMEKSIASSFVDSGSVLLSGHPKAEKVHLILLTADRGLCGSHNSSVIRQAMVLAKQKGSELSASCIGKKGAAFVEKNGYNLMQHLEADEKLLESDELMDFGNKVFDGFVRGDFEKVYLVYNKFVTTIFQETRDEQALPFSFEKNVDNEGGGEVMTEPSGRAFLDVAVRSLFHFKLKMALINSFLSEHASRMTAMENASSNSDELIFRYGKLKNRARQTTITNELIEIVAGKEAIDD